MAAFRKQQSLERNFRATHDEVRELWKLTTAEDPAVGLLRRRLQASHPASKMGLEGRARWLWPKLFHLDYPATGLMPWSQTAPAGDLLRFLRAAIIEGGVMRPGRKRPGGRRSEARLEPVILGVAHGAHDSSDASDGLSAGNEYPRPGVGRPRDDLAVQLIAFLAGDWAFATDEMPQQDRSDKTPFGDLVHQVFGWLDLLDATGVLRRYWRAYKSSPTAMA